MDGATPRGHEPLTPAVFHVLLALHRGPSHGYAVMGAVEASSGIRMGPGTVYGTIGRLEARGLVREAGEEEGETRPRKLYELTPEGREALRDEAVRLRRLAALADDLGLAEGRR